MTAFAGDARDNGSYEICLPVPMDGDDTALLPAAVFGAPQWEVEPEGDESLTFLSVEGEVVGGEIVGASLWRQPGGGSAKPTPAGGWSLPTRGDFEGLYDEYEPLPLPATVMLDPGVNYSVLVEVDGAVGAREARFRPAGVEYEAGGQRYVYEVDGTSSSIVRFVGPESAGCIEG